MNERIFLIGPPGAGKSTIGKALATELGWSFIDTDREIERTSGRRIPDIFLEDGEVKFREMEREIVLRVASHDAITTPTVVALGGGAILDPLVFELLAKDPGVIYLEVSISNAAPRIGFNRERPLLLGNPRQQWLALYEARRAKYESLAKLKFSTDNKKPREVVAEITSAIS